MSPRVQARKAFENMCWNKVEFLGIIASTTHAEESKMGERNCAGLLLHKKGQKSWL
jgi:hypothetical protein